MQPVSLKTNISWTFVGNVIYAACQWGILVVLTKLGTPEMVGIFTLGLAITAPVYMFTNLQLRSVQATDARNDNSFREFFVLRIIGSILAFMFIIMLIIFMSYDCKTSLVLTVISFSKFIESISDIIHGKWQYWERMDLIATSIMAKGILSLWFIGLCIWVTNDLLYGTIGLVVAWLVVLYCYDIRKTMGYKDRMLGSHDSTLLRLNKIWHLALSSLPLGIVMMLISLNVNIPRYYIENYLGLGDLGIYGAIIYLSVAGNAVVNAVGNSASPKLAKYYAQGQFDLYWALIYKLLAVICILGITGFVVACLFGANVLQLIYRKEYAEKSDLLVLVMGAACFNYIASILGYSITAARKFRIQTAAYLLITGSSLLASYMLIPRYSLLGAGWAFLSASVVNVLTFSFVILSLYYQNGYKDNRNRVWKWL